MRPAAYCRSNALAKLRHFGRIEDAPDYRETVATIAFDSMISAIIVTELKLTVMTTVSTQFLRINLQFISNFVFGNNSSLKAEPWTRAAPVPVR